MNILSLISNHKKQIDVIASMQDLIFDLENDNYEKNFDALKSQYNLNDKNFLRHLLATIGIAFHMNPTITDLLIQILLYISTNIQNHFTPHEIYNVLCCNTSNYLLLQLSNNDILSFGSISSIPHDESDEFLIYFAPEFQQYFPDKFNNSIKKLLTIDIEEHKQLRLNGVNESFIASVIRNDDIEKFVEFVSPLSVINSKISVSLYEKCPYLNKEPTFFEYAAFYGSIQIFKYLISNKVAPPANLAFFAAAGGYPEVIHLCEEMSCNFEPAMNACLLFHQNEILNYLVDQEIAFPNNSIAFCIEGYNFQQFYQFFDKNNFDKNQRFGDNESFLIYTMKHLYSEFGIALTSLTGNDFNKNDNILKCIF